MDLPGLGVPRKRRLCPATAASPLPVESEEHSSRKNMPGNERGPGNLTISGPEARSYSPREVVTTVRQPQRAVRRLSLEKATSLMTGTRTIHSTTSFLNKFEFAHECRRSPPANIAGQTTSALRLCGQRNYSEACSTRQYQIFALSNFAPDAVTDGHGAKRFAPP